MGCETEWAAVAGGTPTLEAEARDRMTGAAIEARRVGAYADCWKNRR